MSKTLHELGEHKLLDLIRKRWDKSAPGLDVGIGDDAAVFDMGSNRKGLLTCDMLIEDVHFKLGWYTPFQVGYKAMAVNLSDIAAMGGIPRYALVSLALPPHIDLSWVEGFYEGMDKIAQEFNVIIIGGDTCASFESISINITIMGEVPANEVTLRSGAKIGDKILVTGTLGDSALGLSILFSNKIKDSDTYLLNKHLQPRPRCNEARIIAQSRLAASMMDISDGLTTDIANLTQMSKTGARIYSESIPMSEELINRAPDFGKKAVDFAVSGGEDYELLLTAPASNVEQLKTALSKVCPLTVIGEITHKDEGIILADKDGKIIPWPKGYEHFQPIET